MNDPRILEYIAIIRYYCILLEPLIKNNKSPEVLAALEQLRTDKEVKAVTDFSDLELEWRIEKNLRALKELKGQLFNE